MEMLLAVYAAALSTALGALKLYEFYKKNYVSFFVNPRSQWQCGEWKYAFDFTNTSDNAVFVRAVNLNLYEILPYVGKSSISVVGVPIIFDGKILELNNNVYCEIVRNRSFSIEFDSSLIISRGRDLNRDLKSRNVVLLENIAIEIRLSNQDKPYVYWFPIDKEVIEATKFSDDPRP